MEFYHRDKDYFTVVRHAEIRRYRLVIGGIYWQELIFQKTQYFKNSFYRGAPLNFINNFSVHNNFHSTGI
ncbi:hypothetical protein J7K99_01910 [bacterium]|nr:hypothetical protein [bacterium]